MRRLFSEGRIKSDGEGVEALPIGDYLLKSAGMVCVSSYQLGEVLGGTPHFEEDQT